MTHKNDRTARDLESNPAFQLAVYGLADLGGPWAGWKLRGSHLVSPDRDRVTPEQLRGLLFLEGLKPKTTVGQVAGLPWSDPLAIENDLRGSGGRKRRA